MQPPPSGVDLLSEILPVLAGGVINNSSGKILSGDLTGLSSSLNPGAAQFLTDRNYDNTRPKAYLNWILFDDQFGYVASNSGVQQVLAGSSAQVLSAPLQNIGKNGYLYVYVSNESQQDVYFDQLTVKHYSGPLLQEQSYYPFGLQMAGISDKALLKQTAPYKYDGGVELEEEYGLNYYNTFYRKYDPQIGRFTGMDMMSEQAIGMSPYHYAANSPVNYNDPSGLFKTRVGHQAPINVYYGDNGTLGSSFGSGPWGGYWSSIIGFGLSNNNSGLGFTATQASNGGGWEFNEFSTDVDEFTSGAITAFTSGFFGSGQSAINGFNGAQNRFAEMTGHNPGLLPPVIAEGRIWSYDGKSHIRISNWNDLMAQLGRNGAYEWADYFKGKETREGILTAFDLTEQVGLKSIDFGFNHGNYAQGLRVTSGIGKVFSLISIVNSVIDIESNPAGLQTHNVIDIAASVLTGVPEVGEIFGTFWFIGNSSSQLITGKSISEYMQDEWDPVL